MCFAPAPGVRTSGLNSIRKHLVYPLATLALTSGFSELQAATDDSPINAQWQKPVWLTEISFSAREGYDNNVFGAGADSKYFPANYQASVPSGSPVAVKGDYSWVTTLTPKIGFNFAPLISSNGPLQTVSLGYAPECAFYHEQPSETYQAHRVATAIKGGADDVNFALDNNFTFVNGDRTGPFYPGGYLNCYASALARERREQCQDRANLVVQYDQELWFARATGSLLYYDLMTEQINVFGYQNYCDRYDANGGGDVGYKILPQFAVTLGWRYGHQYQQAFSFSPYSSSSDYQRALLGAEGHPWKWLEMKIQGGPDFRSYDDNAPVDNRHTVKYYGEASLTATITSADMLSFKYKQWQWVSSTGRIPYFDTSCDLIYHRKLTDKLGFDLGGKLLRSDYTSGDLVPTSRRKDTEYVATSGLTYAITTRLSASAGVEFDFGRNDQNNISNPSTREFDRQLYTLGLQWKL
jgi:hypothetical protein